MYSSAFLPPLALFCFSFPATAPVCCHPSHGAVTGHIREEEAHVLLLSSFCWGLGPGLGGLESGVHIL